MTHKPPNCLECAQGRHSYSDYSYWAEKPSPWRRCDCCRFEPGLLLLDQ